MSISSSKIKESLKVYFIMGSTNCDRDPRDVLREAIEGGITIFQYREKGNGALKGEEKRKLASDLQAICRVHDIPFIVNDDIDLALALDADGVHVGQEDEPLTHVRNKLGAEKIIGVSAHTLEEAIHAIDQGANYLGHGPIYATSTKRDVKEVRGTKWIQTFREKGIAIPLVGIGGIKRDNASEVVGAGADGVSVITAISQATSPRQAAHDLRQVVEQVLNKNE